MKRPLAVISCLLCAGLLIACGPAAIPPTAAPTPVPEIQKSGTIRLFELANPDLRDLPIQFALEDLEAQGYTIEITAVDTSTIIAEALALGDADVASLNALTMWFAVAEGADVRAIFQDSGNTLTVVASEEIQTCDDLDGRPVASSNVTGLNPSLFARFIELNCPGTEPDLVAISQSSGRIAALLAGEVDAALLQTEQLLQLERDAPGEFHALALLGQEFPDLLASAFHVRRDWAEQNRGMVEDFIEASLVNLRAVYDAPEAFYEVASERLDMAPVVAHEVGEAYLAQNLWEVNGGLSTEVVQYNLDFLTEAEGLSSDLTVADVADLSYLEAVLAEIGRQ